jgi:uncharacterized protein (TIGR02145 family)
MKKIFTLVIGIAFSMTVLNAQEAPPQAFSFKATIQGVNGQTVVNKMISLRITILQDDMNGFPVYSEFFTPTTNHYSQVDVEIGHGNVLSGTFSSIDWSAHKCFLKIEVDAKGGTDYQLLSITQLLSVPYAMYAGSAGNAFSGNYDDLIGAPMLSLVATSGSFNDLFDTPTLFSGDYNDLTNKPTLFSGNYEDLLNKPTLFDGTWDALTGKPTFANVAFSGSYADLLNKPVLFSGDYSDLNNKPALFSGNYDDLINKPTNLSQFSNDAGFLTEETDPIFSAHPANGITSGNIVDWNTAFGWGNHAGLYKPIAYVPNWSEIISKPTFAAVATSGSYYDLTDKPTIDGSETKVSPGTNVTVTGEGTGANPYVINSAGGSGALTLSQVLTFGNDARDNKIINLSDPVNAQDAVTKAYVDALMQRVGDLEGLLSGANISDIDGNIYDVVTIGEQVWMAENLRTTKLNNGTPITLVNDLLEWDRNDGSHGRTAPMVCWYDYETANNNIYGGLYNRYCVSSIVCPTGWHVPSAEEWEALIDFLGGGARTGGKMRSTGTIERGDGLWHQPNDRATNESGFTGHPGGLVDDSGREFDELGYTGDWWGYYLDNRGEEVFSVAELKGQPYDLELDPVSEMANPGYSIRCIKD